MSEQSTILNLPYIQPSQAQKHVTHNEAHRSLDLLVQLSVKSQTVSATPVTPTVGDRYIVGAGATGSWAGEVGQITLWDGVSWSFTSPLEGWRCWVADQALMMIYDGSGWVPQIADFQDVDGIGVQATYDAINRFAVSSDASLLTHAGNGHQLKVNKNAVADTASLLFQTGYSGRAEMGLAGEDAFSVKTSTDGTNWNQALTIDGTGKVGVGKTPAVETLEVAGNVLADAHLTPSDRRLKTNVRPAEPCGATLDSLSVVAFDWMDGGSVSHGLIAQEVAEVVPDAVQKGAEPDQRWAIDAYRLVPMLLQEVQQLRDRLSKAGL